MQDALWRTKIFEHARNVAEERRIGLSSLTLSAENWVQLCFGYIRHTSDVYHTLMTLRAENWVQLLFWIHQACLMTR